MDLDSLSSNLQRNGLSPFLRQGGQVQLRAGRDLKGALLGREQDDVSQWWWRSGVDGASATAWWSRYDRFGQGIASFGGGDVRLLAGRDAQQVHASAASSGWRASDADSASSQALQVLGGSVFLQAGRDVVAGRLFAAGPQLRVQAGGDVRRDTAAPASATTADLGLQLLYGATAVRAEAAGALDVGALRSAGYALSTKDNELALGAVLGGLNAGASALLQSQSGSVTLRNDGVLDGGMSNAPDLVNSVVPAQLQIRAPRGDVSITHDIVQMPEAGGAPARTEILADGDVNLAALKVGAQRQALETGLYSRRQLGDALANAQVAVPLTRYADLGVEAAAISEVARLDSSDRSPVRVAAGGDIKVEGEILSARALDLKAGRDLIAGSGNVFKVQHQDVQLSAGPTQPLRIHEFTVLQAGRDMRNVAVEIAGPGDLLLLAGRDVDLGNKAGLLSLGALRNGNLLPSLGADITVVTGLRADGRDYQQAVDQGFALFGSRAWQGRLGQLYGALGGPLQGFEQLARPAQLDGLRRLMGDAQFDAALADYVRGLPARADASEQGLRAATLLGKPLQDKTVQDFLQSSPTKTEPAWSELSREQALAVFATLGDSQKAAAVQALLMAQLGRQAPQARQQLLQQLAGRDALGQAALQALAAYVREVSGDAARGLSDSQAVAAFEALPLARQIPWLNRQLVQELRLAGREAALAEGDARWVAYAPAYLAVNTLFPVDGLGARPGGELRMPTSQIKTNQQADITLMAPGGGVNAGELASSGSGKKPNELGIVTVSGGSVSAAVRDDFAVNQSRVFTLAQGDLLLWSSRGNIDAGRGAKTVTGAPSPVLRLDNEGQLIFDTSGSFSGSGIAVLSTGSDLDLFAPAGEINAGEAGIRSKGNAFIAAERVVNAVDIQVGGKTSGGGKVEAPAATISAPPNTTLNATSAGVANSESDEDGKKKRRRRRNLLLEFLGFGGQ
ncbi:MAG: hypothetical protein CFE41_11550 [Burkholderiales bacterium PBB2]|nr:MAG: hypothetical protein CFE41_11550 [Burkholderiales bacterium PBB2]